MDAATDPDATIVHSVLTRTGRVDPDATVILGAARPTPPPGAPALPEAPPLALAVGTRLHEYRIDGVLGQGGFGITYLATDVNLNAAVAIKEYLPEEIAFRAGDRSVSPNASGHRDRYRQGLESFLAEARTLASFRHPALVRVARFFEAHRTAYMVLEYERGSPLRAWWPAHREIGESALIGLLLPLLDGLAAVHGAGYLHRDIKPDNIQVRAADGSLVLLDFGSAGQTVAAGGQGAVALTPGYAPIEQYGLGVQGAWTDLYALGATLYWAVTGRKPPDAETRAAAPSSYVPAVEAGAGHWGSAFLRALDWALETDPARRPPSVAEFRRALCADHLASLGLAEALQRGETRPDAGAPRGALARAAARARGALRLLVSPRDWPLAPKLALALVGSALLPMGLAGAYNLGVGLEAVSAGELRAVEQIAHSTAGRVAQFVGDSRNLARAVASDGAFAAYLARPEATTAAALTAQLRQIVAANPEIQLLMLMDTGGLAVIANDAAVLGRNFSFREYFKSAIAGRPYASGITVGSVAGEPGIYYAEPVRGVDGAVAGVLVLRMRGSVVARILAEVHRDSNLTPFMVDGDGVVVEHGDATRLYHSLRPLPPATARDIRADQRFGRDRIDSLGETELARALLGARSAGHVSYRSARDGSEQIAGYAPVDGRDWVVGVTEPRATFEAPLQRLYRELLVSVALVGLLFTGLALRLARGIVRPIRALTDAANALKAGDYEGASVQVASRDEVGQLGRTFNVMIDVLRQRDRERGP